MSVRVAGVDGCRGGWIVASALMDDGRLRALGFRWASTFAVVISGEESVVTIDVPIGLLDEFRAGGRDCDYQSRALLGWPRGTSVFSAPSRSCIGAGSYEDAKALCPMSRQTYAILPKVAEVDRVIEPEHQRRIREVHAEVSFRMMSGRPMHSSKKTAIGRDERMAVLDPIFPNARQLLADRPAGANRDDAIDALVACWTAARVAAASAVCIPAQPPRDSRGLQMAIWA